MQIVGHVDGATADQTAGFGPPIISCDGKIWIALTGRGARSTVVLSYAPDGRRASHSRIPLFGIASLACLHTAGRAKPAVFVAISDAVHGWVLCVERSCHRSKFGPKLIRALVGWRRDLSALDVTEPVARIGRYNVARGHLISSLRAPEPGDTRLAADGSGVYLLNNGTVYRVSLAR
jgi:hypothetical protein